jgi:hypothetical protein
MAVRTDFLRGLFTNTRHAYMITSLLSKPVSPGNECKDTKRIYDFTSYDLRFGKIKDRVHKK